MTPATTPADDRPAVASAAAADLRLGLPLMRDQRDRLSTPAGQRMLAALRRAIGGVLNYSVDRDELDLALGALEELELARHGRRLRADTEALRGHGATIPARAVSDLIERRAADSVRAHLADYNRRRSAGGLSLLP